MIYLVHMSLCSLTCNNCHFVSLKVASVFKLLTKLYSKVLITDFIISDSPRFEMQFMYRNLLHVRKLISAFLHVGLRGEAEFNWT